MDEIKESVYTSDQESELCRDVDVCRDVDDKPSEVPWEIKGDVCDIEHESVGVDEVIENPGIDTKYEEGGVPLDHGWAWLVLLGTFLLMTVVIGIMKSSGLLFVAFQEHFRSSSSATSLISTVQNATCSISALTVMTVFTRRFKIRYLVMVGSMLVCIAYIISSQATDIRVLLLSHGVLQGIGMAFMVPTSVTLLGLYFDKRRGFANSVAVSGCSLGGLCLAPLITNLLATYGYQGCMLILAGLMFNICISAALFRPPSFYTKPKSAENDSDFTKTKLITDTKLSVGAPVKNEAILTRHVLNGLKHKRFGNKSPIYKPNENAFSGIDPRLLGSEPLLNSASKGYRLRTFTESSGVWNALRNRGHSEGHELTSRDLMTGSYMDLPGANNRRNSDELTSLEIMSTDKTGHCNLFKYISTLFDFKLFKDPVFVFMQISFGLTCSGNVLTTVFIAPFAAEVGVDASGIANIIIIFNAIDLCSRIGIGLIADLQLVRRSTIIGICAMVVSLTSFLIKFYTSFGIIVFYAVILGLFTGGYFALFAVVIVDYMTLAKLHVSLGFVTLFDGSFVAIGFIIVGALRDSTGSYVASFYYIGTIIFIGGAIMFILPHIERYRDRKRATGKEINGV